MATKTKTTTLTNTGLKIGKLALYVNNAAQTYRVGKGKAQNIGYLFGSMSKGEARKLRKALHALGYGNAVRVSRINEVPLDTDDNSNVKLAA
jgi:hypothetical protein